MTDRVGDTEVSDTLGAAKFQGYVPISRSFFNGPFWSKKRTFSHAEAYIDICQTVRYSHDVAKKLIGTKMLKWGRGQMPGSIRFLATRWKWSPNKVQRFLALLVSEKLISVDLEQAQTVITLLSEKRIRYSDNDPASGRTQPSAGQEEDSDEERYDSEYADDSENDCDAETGTNTKQKDRRDNSVKRNKKGIQYAHDAPDFINLFNDWIKYNKEKGKKLTPSTITEQNNFLEQFSVQDSIEMLKQSIRNNWAGIFELKTINHEKEKSSASKVRIAALKKF